VAVGQRSDWGSYGLAVLIREVSPERVGSYEVVFMPNLNRLNNTRSQHVS